MKTLLLLRHAKSSWADPGQPDFERPLNERGRQTAQVIAVVLLVLGAGVLCGMVAEYNDLELICRDAARVEKFMTLAGTPRDPTSLRNSALQVNDARKDVKPGRKIL